jgi:hypothetical protein
MRKAGRTAILVVATVVATLSVQQVMAAITGTATLGAKAIAVASGGPNSTNSAGSFIDIPGAIVTVTVPQKQTGLVVGRFAGESTCNQGPAGSNCRVVMLIQGPGFPAAGAILDGAGDRFDADDTGDNYPEAHAVQGWKGGLAPGTYTIRARYHITNPPTVFTLTEWTLTAELWRSS